ncbi:MAG: hypothetical protein ABSG10_05110, partial [Terracidiphilus sp.]|jgi:hypothetical protein
MRKRNSAGAREQKIKQPSAPAAPLFVVSHIPEPKLEFAYGQKVEYPRDGLFLFGPCDATKEFSATRFGVIGTAEGVKRFERWSEKMRGNIAIPAPGPRSRGVEPQHVAFPGFKEAFHSEWPEKPVAVIDDITTAEIKEKLYIHNRHEAIHGCVDIYVSRLVHEENRLEAPPSFWFVIIPEMVYELGRPQSRVPRADALQGEVTISQKKAQDLKMNPTLFGEEEEDAGIYEYATHFRRQIKARLLKHRIVTQIVRETTLAPGDFMKANGMPLRRLEDPATVAWKLGTGAYYKGGGRPWQLANVRPGVCYVGLVYKRTDLTTDVRHACCAAQMFLTNGDGVVFRGALGPWFHEDTKQFHLDKTSAERLVQVVIEEYLRQQNEPPRELFIHATSNFTDEEWAGFAIGAGDNTSVVGIQISDAFDDLKLYRTGKYPTIRGTALVMSQTAAFLWTSGFVPRLDTYMGPDTPNPLMVRIQKGKCELDTVLNDILGLTKINFNSCLFNDRLPVTIKFANDVGDVLIAAPMDCEPRLPFKFYI